MITSTSTSSNSLNQIIIETNQQNLLCNKHEILDERQPCNYEEADYRSLLHAYAYNASRKGFKKSSITMVATDVVVIGHRAPLCQ